MGSAFERMQRGFGGDQKAGENFVSMLVNNGGKLKEVAHTPSPILFPAIFRSWKKACG
jgi:hypothetical protein